MKRDIDDPSVLNSMDVALVVTDHSDFDFEHIAEHAPLVVDTRNACAGVTRFRKKIVRA